MPAKVLLPQAATSGAVYLGGQGKAGLLQFSGILVILLMNFFYTTAAIESLHSVIRKPVKKRKRFPSDTAALKVVYLSAMEASTRHSSFHPRLATCH